MRSFFLPAALLTPLASAHFALNYPSPRGSDTETMPEYPCGGLSASSNRTQISLDEPVFPVEIDLGHDQTAVQVLIGLGSNPDYNVTLRKTFRIEGLGSFCIPEIELTEDILGTELVDGLNLTLQVVSNGHPSGGLYTCADLQLTAGTVDASSAPCSNNTGVEAFYFEGAAADRNANASTSDGQAQGGEDDHGHSHGDEESTGEDHSDHGDENATETESADDATPTDGANALQAAGWGVLGAAVVGAMAIL
ncbi:hypothetical protein BJY04DRAFT_183510 [Aspergillus karnatakaensis]|uniref:putative GPI anchored protein n=1 Tax=Aspergillus karnatakaensis TaxID=1810916 RepID=UPI003CCD5F20